MPAHYANTQNKAKQKKGAEIKDLYKSINFVLKSNTKYIKLSLYA